MAKVQDGIIKVRGKFGNYVVTNGIKQGPVLRRRPDRKLANESEPFKKQASRAAVLNKLASEINNVIRHFHADLRPRDLYQRLLGYLRKESSDNRFMLLQVLKGLEINTRYRFDKLGELNLDIKREGEQLEIALDVLEHLPNAVKYHSYCYELLLICWTRQDELPRHIRKFTKWIDSHGPKEGFDLQFKFPEGTTHWMLFIHHRGRSGNGDDEFMTGQGMKVLELGTMISSEQELLEARENEKKQQAKISTGKKEDNEERVEARKVGG